MAIYRLSIEVLQGERSGDTPESHAAAVAELAKLRAEVSGVDGVISYPEDETAPWGVPQRPDTFNLDLDTGYAEEVEVDRACLEKVTEFLLRRP